MNDQPQPQKPVNADEVLDQLLDALLERNAERRRRAAAAQQPAERPSAPTQPAAPGPPEPAPEQPAAPVPGDADWQPPAKVPPMGLDRFLWRMALAIALLAVLINIPITRYGVSLARILPDSRQMVIRDGLLVKGSGPEVYRLEEGKLRWVSSLDAFAHLGLEWDDVHQVEDAFIAGYEQGAPIHVLIKCAGSPHIYRVEGLEKRWIRDIPTLKSEGHTWEDVRMVDCAHLEGIPSGLPIPPDAGEPPATR